MARPVPKPTRLRWARRVPISRPPTLTCVEKWTTASGRGSPQPDSTDSPRSRWTRFVPGTSAATPTRLSIALRSYRGEERGRERVRDVQGAWRLRLLPAVWNDPAERAAEGDRSPDRPRGEGRGRNAGADFVVQGQSCCHRQD